MSNPMHVKVSSRYQIAVPSRAREKLNIQQGDRLLVDIQDGMIILIPQPAEPHTYLVGLHREVWQGIDAEKYLREERAAWDDSPND
jgi:AbrB family looped-hinge helix DNA binding protein